MNLQEWQRVGQTLFGECPGCEDCAACRLQTLIKNVWDSGRRSGAATSADRKAKSTTWDEWEWTPAHREDLVVYTMKVFPEWRFKSREEALAVVRTQMARAYEWQGSRDRVVRAMDWVLFMKKWIRREAGQTPAVPPQAGLFDQPSPRPSPASRREEEREEVYKRLTNRSETSGLH